MRDKFPLIILFLALCGVLAISVWTLGRPIPVLTKDQGDIDDTIIGDSATDDHTGNDGPAYMGANWAWPMPLAFWQPSTSVN